IMAVSQTSDPSGTWNLYRIRYPSTAGGITAGGCPDQGKGGVDNNGVGLGFNEFAVTGTPGCPRAGTFRGAGPEGVQKAQMLAGWGATSQRWWRGRHRLTPSPRPRPPVSPP